MTEGLLEIRHEDALTLAAQRDVSAYDSRYLVVAQRLQTRLITEDAKLRKKAPDLTCSIADALAG
jgi:predicted nucleic acid-binding protein